MAKPPKINVTKNYALFTRDDDNRPLDLAKHKKLCESMETHGFRKTFPIVCIRDENGHLIIKDGQHRFAFAQELGLEVYWVESDTDFDTAELNNTAKVWVLSDYAQKFAASGNAAYETAVAFSEEHGLPLGVCCAMLAGYTTFSNISAAFVEGKFKVSDRAWADSVASVYGTIVGLAPTLKGARLLEACMAVCRVTGFEKKRMTQTANIYPREKLIKYATREAYLDLLEKVYNYKRPQLVALRMESEKAIRARNPKNKKVTKNAA